MTKKPKPNFTAAGLIVGNVTTSTVEQHSVGVPVRVTCQTVVTAPPRPACACK